MSKHKYKGFSRITHAFIYSLEGLTATFKSEEAFRQEVIIALFAIPLALWLEVTIIAKAMMISSIFIILIAELANSAIESVVDRISLDHHILSKKAKDIGSAIVLVAFINAIFIWAIILVG